jgi:hypothetical protein
MLYDETCDHLYFMDIASVSISPAIAEFSIDRRNDEAEIVLEPLRAGEAELAVGYLYQGGSKTISTTIRVVAP